MTSPKSTARIALTALVALVSVSLGTAGAQTPAPYQIKESVTMLTGIRHLTLSRSDRVEDVAHAAIIPTGAAAALRVATAGDGLPRVKGPVARTSEMCARLACLIAVNGPMKESATHRPIGAVVQDGELIRSPIVPSRPEIGQLMVLSSGAIAIGALKWDGALVVPGARIELAGVNVARGADQLVLYTPRFGPETETDASGFEVVFKAAHRPGLDRTINLELIKTVAPGNTPIPADGGVLSAGGRAADTLRAIWQRVQNGGEPGGWIRMASALGVTQSISGRPVLVRNGKAVALTNRDVARIDDPNPRTIVGRTADGNVLMVTVDGRQEGYSDGMTLPEAADMMIGMGAVDAINLDGGGSTTFVVGGDVANRPSDRIVVRGGHKMVVKIAGANDKKVEENVERQVSAALVVVPVEIPAPAAPSPSPEPARRAPAPGMTPSASPAPRTNVDGLAVGTAHDAAAPVRPWLTGFAAGFAIAVWFARRRLRARLGAD